MLSLYVLNLDKQYSMPTVRRHYRPHSRRDTRPSVKRALTRLHDIDAALLACWQEYDGVAPYSPEGIELLTKIHTLRRAYYDTYWQLFRSLGYNLVLLRRLTRRT